VINFYNCFLAGCGERKISERTQDNALFNIFSCKDTVVLRWLHVRVVSRACTANGPELKSLASGRSRLGEFRKLATFIFHRRQEIDGDNDASLIHVAALRRNNACWRGRDLITDKRPPCYAAPVEAIRVPVRWILIRDGESNSWNRLRGKGRARMEEGEYNGIRETSEDEWQLDLGN